MSEMSFYYKLFIDSGRTDVDWPMLHQLTRTVPVFMAPPVSWSLVIEELGRYLISELGLAETAALRSVLAAQLAALPSFDRNYPETVELECDVVAWHLAIMEQKERGNRRDWTDKMPRLEAFGPGTLTVGDSFGVTAGSLGINRELNAFGVNWELESPLHRARADLS